MKSFSKKFVIFMLAILVGILVGNGYIYADEENDNSGVATSISISPVSKILQLAPNSVYEDKFTITNNGNSEMEFEVYAAPYSYTYSEADDAYRLGFNRESGYTQIVRWITFKDASSNYVEKTTFTAEPNSSVTIEYKISTPENLPAGGQYAVLFAHTISNSSDNTTGIKTEASPGLVVYGRAEGETIITSEISNLQINQTIMSGGEEKNLINASAKVKNTGNVDFMATGVLKVTGIFGNVYYESTGESSGARISVIPDTELEVSDVWNETPFFGMFNVEWTVYANGEASETITKFIVIMPAVVAIAIILLLTIIIIWIIIMVGKRKERRSKFMV